MKKQKLHRGNSGDTIPISSKFCVIVSSFGHGAIGEGDRSGGNAASCHPAWREADADVFLRRRIMKRPCRYWLRGARRVA